MFERAKNFAKKAKKFDDENRTAKKNAPLWLVILNDGMPIFSIVAFVLMGALANLWHPGWLILFIIPLYYSLIEAIKHKNANMFAFPFLAVGIFLLIGFLNKDLWHPAWAVLLTIPIYYLTINVIVKRAWIKVIDMLVPLLATIVFIAIGISAGKWHPAWVAFLVIPIYFSIRASISKYNKRNATKDENIFSQRISGKDDDDDVIIK